MAIFHIQDLVSSITDFLTDREAVIFFLSDRTLYGFTSSYHGKDTYSEKRAFPIRFIIRDIYIENTRAPKIDPLKHLSPYSGLTIGYIRPSELPESITSLTLTKFSRGSLNYPTTLRSLTIEYDRGNPIGDLPESLTELTVRNYDHPVDNLPKSLRRLVLGWSFNQMIDNLPASLTYLELGREFNKPIDRLPTSLQTLSLGDAFNQSLDSIPASVTTLLIGVKQQDYDWPVFNQNIDKLPNTVRELALPVKYDCEINHLPDSLEKLVISESYVGKIETLIKGSVRVYILEPENRIYTEDDLVTPAFISESDCRTIPYETYVKLPHRVCRCGKHNNMADHRAYVLTKKADEMRLKQSSV